MTNENNNKADIENTVDSPQPETAEQQLSSAEPPPPHGTLVQMLVYWAGFEVVR